MYPIIKSANENRYFMQTIPVERLSSIEECYPHGPGGRCIAAQADVFFHLVNAIKLKFPQTAFRLQHTRTRHEPIFGLALGMRACLPERKANATAGRDRVQLACRSFSAGTTLGAYATAVRPLRTKKVFAFAFHQSGTVRFLLLSIPYLK